MDSSDHPLQIKKKPIDDIFILLKDLRSDIAQIRRDILLLKNELNKINSGKETDTTASGWFFT